MKQTMNEANYEYNGRALINLKVRSGLKSELMQQTCLMCYSSDLFLSQLVLTYLFTFVLFLLEFYCNLNATSNDSVRGLFVLFGQLEFNGLLRKHNLKNTGHVGLQKYCIKQTFNNAVEQLMNNDFA